MAETGTAARTIEWAMNNLGAGLGKVRRWDSKAGFAYGTAWCGIFLANAMRAQGLPVPKGFAAATNWSTYGASVKSLREAQPGDILVYGTNHVAMYLGNGRQIQGNNSNGTVGTSGVGANLGLGPITAIRRPPYKGSTGAGSNILGDALHGALGAIPEGPAAFAAAEAAANAIGDHVPSLDNIAGEVLSGLAGDLAKSAEPLMLNIGLIAGGAFLVYYGASLIAGIQGPSLKLARAGLGPAAVVERQIAEIHHALTCEVPAELRDLIFDGGAGEFEQLDDVGAPALSYGVINPVEVTAYVNFRGGPARAGNAIPVPPKSALIMPIATPGHVNLGLDQAGLGAETATIYRLRFHRVQAFFLGAI